MSGDCLHTAGGRRRALVVLLAVAVLGVPALVRATDAPKGSATPPLLRLNRGFNGPETKSRLTPPAAQPVEAPEAEPPSAPGTGPDATRLDEPLPDRLLDGSPDTLRGPPAFAHAH
jgi:hypothetical protein